MFFYFIDYWCLLEETLISDLFLPHLGFDLRSELWLGWGLSNGSWETNTSQNFLCVGQPLCLQNKRIIYTKPWPLSAPFRLLPHSFFPPGLPVGLLPSFPQLHLSLSYCIPHSLPSSKKGKGETKIHLS